MSELRPFQVLEEPIPAGQLLLEASAGTGKTFAITGLVLRCLLEDKVGGLANILVVTFTNAATEELKTRIRTAIQQTLSACRGEEVQDQNLCGPLGRMHGVQGIPRLEAALASADEMSVCTIHSFCRRVLEEAAFETGLPFQIDFVQDESTQVLEAAQDALREVVLSAGPNLAMLADSAKLTPTTLATLHKDWQRHPDTVLQPDPAPLEDAMATLAELERSARTELNPEGLTALGRARALHKDEGESLRIASKFCDDVERRRQAPNASCLDLIDALAKATEKSTADSDECAPAARQLLDLCSEVRTARDAAVASLQKALLLQMHRRLSGGKAKASVLSLDDLLREVDRAIADEARAPLVLGAIRNRWQVALVDEFQDTDPLQYRIFHKAFAGRPLFLVGDPKQSIYAFRGADVHAYLRARDDATTQGTLHRNFRSHPLLVAAVDQLFRGPYAFAEPRITMPKVTAALSHAERAMLGCDGAPMQLRFLISPLTKGKEPRSLVIGQIEARIANDLADEIVRLLDANIRLPQQDGTEIPLRAAHISVLTRTAKQAGLVQLALRSRHVPSALARSGSLFDCEELTEVRRLLAGLLRPQDLPLLRGLWTTLLWGIPPMELPALERDPVRQQAALDQADKLKRTWVRQGFAVMFHKLLDERNVRSRLLAMPDGDRRLTNYLQVAELLTHAAAERKLLPEALTRWLERQCLDQAELAPELRELRLESDADAVQVMTMHVSKGLENEVVFVPFLGVKSGSSRKQTLHLHRHNGGRAMVQAKDAAPHELDAAAREQVAEDTRLAYVALTRARRRCYLYWGVSYMCTRTALGFLLHGPGRESAPKSEIKDEWWDHEVTMKKSLWQQELQTLVDRSQGAIDLATFAFELPSARVASPWDEARPLARPRHLPTRAPATWTTISFSLLQRGTKHTDLGRDLAEPSHTPLQVPVEAQPSGIHAFAAGAAAGTCLHEILEHTKFAQTGEPAFEQQVREVLQKHGLLEPKAHRQPIDPVAPVTAALRTICSTTLPGLGFAFADLEPAKSRAEWSFWLPTGSVNPRALVSLFARHDNPSYAERLRSMADSVLRGFLHGAIDLLCEHQGRYYVIDWKSNLLGATDADYTTERMQAELDDNHYTLQYHLYLLAVHRLLQSRKKGYDYDQHIGGAAFVFLRGAHHTTRGVLLDRPKRELIEDLADWITG